MGSETEDYLIVPDLQKVVARPRVIGISGKIAAGKTTAARLLERAEFTYGRYSEVLAEIALEQNRPIGRATLQRLGQQVHEDPGQRWLNGRLLGRLKAAGGDLVIDGLRWPEDHAFWVERFGPAYRHVHMFAPDDMRRARYVAAGDSAAQFDAAAVHEVESAVDQLQGLAHVVIPNTRRVEDVQRRLGESIDARLLPTRP